MFTQRKMFRFSYLSKDDSVDSLSKYIVCTVSHKTVLLRDSRAFVKNYFFVKCNHRILLSKRLLRYKCTLCKCTLYNVHCINVHCTNNYLYTDKTLRGQTHVFLPFGRVQPHAIHQKETKCHSYDLRECFHQFEQDYTISFLTLQGQAIFWAFTESNHLHDVNIIWDIAHVNEQHLGCQH